MTNRIINEHTQNPLAPHHRSRERVDSACRHHFRCLHESIGHRTDSPNHFTHRQDHAHSVDAVTRLHARKHGIGISPSAQGAPRTGIVRIHVRDNPFFHVCCRPYALVGFTAFLILLPIAITSTKGWMQRLGQTWTRLHRWVYLAALLVIVHFVWLVKLDVREPLMYGAIVAGLLIMRLPLIRQFVSRIRNRKSGLVQSK
jgi:hypothetical protein